LATRRPADCTSTFSRRCACSRRCSWQAPRRTPPPAAARRRRVEARSTDRAARLGDVATVEAASTWRAPRPPPRCASSSCCCWIVRQATPAVISGWTVDGGRTRARAGRPRGRRRARAPRRVEGADAGLAGAILGCSAGRRRRRAGLLAVGLLGGAVHLGLEQVPAGAGRRSSSRRLHHASARRNACSRSVVSLRIWASS
jgi:hypothetical protein